MGFFDKIKGALSSAKKPSTPQQEPVAPPVQSVPVAPEANRQEVAPPPASQKKVDQNLGPLASLQSKCGVTADGVWGPNTYRAAMKHFNLTNNQAAHFFGQCAHESNNFLAFSENLNYSAEGLNKTFKKYFPTIASAKPYSRKPEKIANKVYANRMGNGGEDSGDGWKFRGRGPIQLTGKENYTKFSKDIGRPDVLTNPEIVANELAFESALWFFKTNNLLQVADRGTTVAIITQITKKINGGTNGLDDRIKKTQQFKVWGM